MASAAPAKQPEFLNSGDSDASPEGIPSQFLLVRGLEPTVTEELLSKGVAKLYKPSHSTAQANPGSTKKGNAKVASTTGDANLGAREGSVRRVLLVRDRRTNESWRYGFAEFTSVEVGFRESVPQDSVLISCRRHKPLSPASTPLINSPSLPSLCLCPTFTPASSFQCSISWKAMSRSASHLPVTRLLDSSTGMRTPMSTNWSSQIRKKKILARTASRSRNQPQISRLQLRRTKAS